MGQHGPQVAFAASAGDDQHSGAQFGEQVEGSVVARGPAAVSYLLDRPADVGVWRAARGPADGDLVPGRGPLPPVLADRGPHRGLAKPGGPRVRAAFLRPG